MIYPIMDMCFIVKILFFLRFNKVKYKEQFWLFIVYSDTLEIEGIFRWAKLMQV